MTSFVLLRYCVLLRLIFEASFTSIIFLFESLVWPLIFSFFWSGTCSHFFYENLFFRSARRFPFVDFLYFFYPFLSFMQHEMAILLPFCLRSFWSRAYLWFFGPNDQSLKNFRGGGREWVRSSLATTVVVTMKWLRSPPQYKNVQYRYSFILMIMSEWSVIEQSL